MTRRLKSLFTNQQTIVLVILLLVGGFFRFYRVDQTLNVFYDTARVY